MTEHRDSVSTKNLASYTSPLCKAITLQTRVICVSGDNYGTPGQAGGSGSFGEEGTRF